MSEEELFKNLIRQRGSIKGNLTRQRMYFQQVENVEVNARIVAELETRLDRIEKLLDSFNNIQDEIESKLNDQNKVQEQEQERNDFENSYFNLVGDIKATINSFFNAQRGPDQDVDGISNISSKVHTQLVQQKAVQLPALKLPNFNGRYDGWVEFRDGFKALVHGNAGLTSIQKFYYLRSCVKDDALHLIESIQVSESNYNTVWELLHDRFEQKALLIHNHIRAMFDYPAMERESHANLRQFLDTMTKNIRALKNLGEETDKWDRLLIYMFCTKMDRQTRREWELFETIHDLPTMEDLNKFLKQRCEVLEKLEVSGNSYSKDVEFKGNKFEKRQKPSQKFNAYSSYEKPRIKTGLSCYFCKNNHTIFKCEKFLELSPMQKSTAVNKINLCNNCLRPSHDVKDCLHSGCQRCGKRHNTLLHADTIQNQNGRKEYKTDGQAVAEGADVATSHREAETNSYESNVAAMLTRNFGNLNISKANADENELVHAISVHNNTLEKSQVILSTAIVKIRDSMGKLHECRALLDSGAQSNFITEKLCKQLKLKTKQGNFCIAGVGNSRSNIKNKTKLDIFSCDETYNKTIDCLVMPHITDNLPTISFDRNLINIPQQMKLADYKFNERGSIDLLIGSSIFWNLLCDGRYQVKNSEVILQDTRLGWVIGGKASVNMTIQTIDASPEVNCFSLERAVTRFWEIDEVSIDKKLLSDSEQFCETQFLETVKRNKDGKFVVTIPFKDDTNKLGSSRDKALQCFYSQETRLEKNAQLKKEYVKFMEEYKSLGHMSEKIETENTDSVSYYMPHHAVLREDSTTTKLSVVFNASMKTNNGLSLNDLQYPGPIIQDELFAILLRFRKHEYVMTADVSKMYRMILVNEEQRCLQQIFWRSNSNEKLKIYELNTITYGTTSAPYLAVRCLTQLAIENSDIYPEASQSIRTSFYMDDYLEGAQTKEKLLKLQAEVSEILSSAGLELRKWLCNKRELCEKFQFNEQLDSHIVKLGENETNKTLGIYWNAHLDTIQFTVNISDTQIITKRSILSLISQIYDPLGLLSPIIIRAKLLIQSLWEANIDWDEEIPKNLKSNWLIFKNELPRLNELRLSRKVVCSEYTRIELHGFGDARERAYGCCLYVRCLDNYQNCSSVLLCSKSRVAPIKQVTLPRLELCAAVLLAKLAHKVIEYLNIKFDKICYWSDSQITLAWIKGSPNKWKTFVANRVSEIQQLSDVNDWYYVKSQDNVSDLISRGTSVNDLGQSKFWWHGPEWLLDYAFKPIAVEKNNVSNLPEQKVIVNTSTTTSNEFDVFSRYSTVHKLKRVFGYVLRFIWNLRCKSKQLRKISKFLTVEELDKAMNELVRITQEQAFPAECEKLRNNLPINQKSVLLSLNPVRIHNIIRVGGRLQNSNHDFDKKHPIILPKQHLFTKLILAEEHERLMHCGPTLLLSSVREKYWPIDGRNQARKVTRNCIRCFKVKPKFHTYQMGELPQSRVNQYLPFFNTGCDFIGPFCLKDRMTRGAKIIKGYVCIFICMATKAIHLEVVSDLTTSCFLAALKRFIGRRGKPLNIYSDNGTNFVGANRELKELYEFICSQYNGAEFNYYLTEQNITWHFIPARAPNFGGIWEAGVKSFKYHFKRIVGEAHLCYEDFSTVLIQIESILNSRPICPLSPLPDQLNPLTPAHLLIGKSLSAIPETCYVDVPENRLKRYQRLQQIIQHFWKRWHMEYLCELQARTKWKQDKPCPVKVGTLVLISDDNAPPLKWPMGRIQELHPGKDGIVRVVTVKFKEGVFKRSLSKLCVLPLECE